ncbi:F-box-like/WD repeat-containing protein Ebi-like protein [Pleurotus pulmonarius]
MLVMPEGPLRFTADDVNILIHAYLQDSGFEHSAFVIRAEAKLEQSPSFHKHIPRGELVELLAKALLFVEVESHWKPNSQENCKTSFSLLEPHVCSLEPNVPPNMPFIPVLPAPPKNNGVVNDVLDANAKRKADTPNGDDIRAEKRAKTDEDKRAESKAKSLQLVPLDGKRTPQLPKSIPNKAVRLLKGHVNEVFVCAWNPAKPNILATGSKDAVVKIWDLSVDGDSPPSVTRDFSSSVQADLTALHWSPDGNLLAVGSYDSVLRVCTVTGQLYFSHAQHKKGPIFAARFSESGRWLLTASLDGTTCVWDVKKKAVHMLYQAHSDCCLDIDWIDDETFTSCGADNLVHIMKVGQTQPIRTLSGHRNEINQIKCNPSRTLIASCSDDTTARIWTVAPPTAPEGIPGLAPVEQEVSLTGHKHCVSGIDWCPRPPAGSNDILATSSFDGTARFWDAITGDCLHTFNDHKRPVYALSFSPDGRWFSTGGGDGYMYIYNTETKDQVFAWHAGFEKPGVFEIDWQQTTPSADEPKKLDRLAIALECRQVGVVDVTLIPAMQ